MTVRCPAKINQYLSVGPLDQNGYHPIHTVMQAISLSDDLIIETGDKDEMICPDPSVPPENTVTKAWRLAREYVDLPPLKVTLSKSIPSQSGLGGGSSDAAGFLRALTRITKGQIGFKESLEIAAAVGADVPFFLIGGRAEATHYGECVQALPDQPIKYLLIVMPAASVSTVSAYRALDQMPRTLRAPGHEHEVFNDFESVAPAESLKALTVLKDLSKAGRGLTGSGAAVYACFDDPSAAENAARSVAEQNVGVIYPCHTLTREESLSIS